MADMDTLALSGRFSAQIQHTSAQRRYVQAHTRQPLPNAPRITLSLLGTLEPQPSAADGASSSLSHRLLPAHPRRAEHPMLVAAGQRSDLRRQWRAGHTCGMDCHPPPVRGIRRREVGKGVDSGFWDKFGRRSESLLTRRQEASPLLRLHLRFSSGPRTSW